jgi:Fe/S biogenesis protein NfuA
MIDIGTEAQAHFRRLIEQQDIPGMGVRLRAVRPGTAKADCELEFCEPADLSGDEWTVELEGFNLYVDPDSARWLEDARIEFNKSATGGQLTIKAPRLKGEVPAASASLIERVQYVIEHEINPGLASHGGKCALETIEADGTVVLRFGGGCHGCGMVDATLRGGIERTLRTQFPEITSVRDATDHSTGRNPYVSRTG